MESRDEAIEALREIRSQIKSMAPVYTNDFEDYDLTETVSDWDIGEESVFTPSELLELQTIYKRHQLRWTDRVNTLKEKMLEAMIRDYSETIRRVELRHRKARKEEREFPTEFREEPMDDDIDDAFDSSGDAPDDGASDIEATFGDTVVRTDNVRSASKNKKNKPKRPDTDSLSDLDIDSD